MIHIRNKGEVQVLSNMFKPSSNFFYFRVCHPVVSVPCSLMVTCWERVGSLVCDVSCVFVTFLCGVLGQMWYLIVLIPDLCFLPTSIFETNNFICYMCVNMVPNQVDM